MSLAALVLAAAAGWLLAGEIPARGIPRLADRNGLARPAGGLSVVSPEPAAALDDLRRRLPLLGGVVLLAGLAAATTGAPMAGLLVVLLGLAGDRWVRARCRAGEEAALRSAVIELCTGLVAELRAGRSPRDALAWAASATSELDTQIRPALEYGRDAPAVLQDLAGRPGGYGLRRLAACWRVAERSGAGLSAAVDRLASGLRGDEAQRREVAAQLAGPRATARLLALLPVFGLLLAAGLGGDPLQVLLHTPHGMACLVLGTILDVTGVVWTERIAAAAERTP